MVTYVDMYHGKKVVEGMLGPPTLIDSPAWTTLKVQCENHLGEKVVMSLKSVAGREVDATLKTLEGHYGSLRIKEHLLESEDDD